MQSINNPPTLNTREKNEVSRAQLVLSGLPYKLFIESCRAEKTKEAYSSSLKAFMLFRSMYDVEVLVTEEPKRAQQYIIDFLMVLKEKGLSWQTRVIRAAALKHFYEMNDVVLNWKKINRFIGEKSRTVRDRAYTHEEVKKMVEKCDERKRVMILLLASTGMRIGALPGLKLKHLKETKYNVYQIAIYEGTSSEYVTFCTPECARAMREYFEFRTRCGEKLVPDSPVIREQFPRNDQFRAVRGRHISQTTIMNTIKEVLRDAGLRSVSPSLEGSKMRKRYEVMQIHGLRKFYDTATTQAGVHPLYVEMLLGHDIQLKGSYFKPSIQDLLEGNDKMSGYSAAIDALTVSEENRLQVQVNKLRADISNTKDIRDLLDEKDNEMKMMREEFERKLQVVMSRIDQNKLVQLEGSRPEGQLHK
jgi:integrase